MLKIRLLGIFTALSILLFCGNSRAQSASNMSPPATVYLNQALDFMEHNSINKKTINWTVLRSETMSRGAGSKSTADTYEAIRFALRKLDDRHSFLQLSPELQAMDKESRAQRGDSMESPSPEKWPPSPYIDRRDPGGSIRNIDGVRVASIVVPMFEPSDDGSMHMYAETLRNAIAKLGQERPKGWIIDLRGNLGGNLWPMLAGVGALAGYGVLGSVIDAEGNKDTWFHAPNGVGINSSDGKRQILLWEPERRLSFTTTPVVALLVDRGTASSGEAIAVGFQGRPLCRTFGRHTHGQTTSNRGFALSDGANLVLATGVEADRNGHVYMDGISPDVELAEETRLPTQGRIDPMSRAAAAWIKDVHLGGS